MTLKLIFSIYSLGKLSVEELILKLHLKRYDDFTLINNENIENVLRKLSSQYLLVYSEILGVIMEEFNFIRL